MVNKAHTCPNCHVSNSEQSAFCINCGSELSLKTSKRPLAKIKFRFYGPVLGLAVALGIGVIITHQRQNILDPVSSIAAITYDWEFTNFSNQEAVCYSFKAGQELNWKTSEGATYALADLPTFLQTACQNVIATTLWVMPTTIPTPAQTFNTTPEIGIASQDLWISGYEMAQPACDGSFITLVMSAASDRVIAGLLKFDGAQYLRDDITCASLNPFFATGKFAGQPIYAVFFGPYGDLPSAQEKCLSLGLTKKSQCYIAPLTDFESDRNVRYGPMK